MANRRPAAAGPYRRVLLVVSPPLCRRCVRQLSGRVRDVPGVSSLRVDPASGLVSVHGDVVPGALVAALNAAGWPAAGVG